MVKPGLNDVMTDLPINETQIQFDLRINLASKIVKFNIKMGHGSFVVKTVLPKAVSAVWAKYCSALPNDQKKNCVRLPSQPKHRMPPNETFIALLLLRNHILLWRD